MNEVASKWEKTGLLEGVPTYLKEDCSKHLEDVATFLIERSEKKKKFYDEAFAAMVIPIVRRLYESPLRYNMPDSEWLCYDFADYKNKSKLRKEDCYAAIDHEAELCAEYTEDLVKRKSKIV
jgi:hypothetical protein